MARLGRQIDHFEQVNVESIRAVFSPDKQYRYTLTMEFRNDLLNNNRSETTTVILKNPSSADEKKSDATIRKVETFVFNRFPKTKYLNIYNIFAYRATDAIELHQLMREQSRTAGVGDENDDFLVQLLQSTQTLIAAWGGPSGIDKKIYSARVGEVKQMIKKHYSGQIFQVCGVKPTTEPLHGLMWGYDYELKQITL